MRDSVILVDEHGVEDAFTEGWKDGYFDGDPRDISNYSDAEKFFYRIGFSKGIKKIIIN